MFLHKSLLSKVSATRFLGQQQPNSRTPRHRHRLTGENLEHRMMLSVSPDWLVTAPECGASSVSAAVGGPNGDVFTAGDFQGSVDFGGQVLTAVGDHDVFVARYNAAGDLLWANAAGGLARDVAYGIDVDTDGNAYVTGTFTATATFGTEELTAPGPTGVFVTKLDTDGNFGWTVTGGGDNVNAGNIGYDIVVGSTGTSVYVTGVFVGEGQFGDQPVNSKRAEDGFVSELDAATGQFFWTKTVAGRGGAAGRGIALDDTDPNILYVTGAFDTVAQFDDIQLKANGDRHFVARMDTSGNFLFGGALSNDGWMVRGAVQAETSM